MLRSEGRSAAHFGRNEQIVARVCAKECADPLLAATVTIHVRRVDQRDASLHGSVEHRQRFRLRHVAPISAKLPRAQTNDRYRPPRPSQNSLLHKRRH
jgi:hypothetical protein